MSSILDKIRNNFKKTFKKDFIILEGTKKPDRYNKNYWLVRIQPKKSRLYILNHYNKILSKAKELFEQ